ncbi:calcium ion transporter [Hyphodiscus hymeniophilus]|uniref:Vacuolar calcium ion transporter n=1 Tax=Hyphodiscus hymeniophilus TaxID=353542 RepID=A0A9P6VJR5_9HELO|nr:calcium ion transporter [Hyphodiscus hymeniophilus]
MPADENTGLLGANGTGNGGVRKKSTFHELFLNKKHTPGMESENKFVKVNAHIFNITKVTLLSNYVNVLLVFVPLGIIAGVGHWNPTVVFILNFFAIVPLAAVLSFATEEISVKLGQTMGGLLNATFGNAVELIVSIVALRNGEIRIVQSSMLGSILSNILLVLGCCFIAGGISNTRTGTAAGIEQQFNTTVASTMSSLMVVASAALIIPATLYSVLKPSSEDTDRNILTLSHGTAIILLILYVLYLFFQLRTHACLFDAESQAEEDDAEEAAMGPWPAAGVLIVVTIAVAICAEYLVDSIDSLVETAHISKTFVGLILLPIVGNAAEHVTAVVVAIKDKMDLALGVAIGSSMQIALLVTPFLVILGWIIGQPMTLHFETFETVVFFLSVLVVTYTIMDGKSNYLEGCMLLGLYIIIALAFLVYPDDATEAPKMIAHSVRSLVGQ